MESPLSSVESHLSKSGFWNATVAFFGLAIAMTGVGVYLGSTPALLNFFLIENPWASYVLWGGTLALTLTARIWMEKRPLNYLLFVSLALGLGVLLAPLIVFIGLEFRGYDIVYKALFATTATFIATAILGGTMKRSLAGLGGFLSLVFIGMFITGIIGIFFPWGNTFEMVYSGIGVILFSAYTMYDMNQIVRGGEKNPLHAAMHLYLDIFNLFVFFLRFLAALNRD